MKTILGFKLPFFAVSGSIVAYYGFAPAYSSGNAAAALAPVALILAVVASFLRVMDSARVRDAQARYRLRKAHAATIFFVTGFAIGIACRGAANKNASVFLGLETKNILAIGGKLLDDPRNTASGRGMATLRLSASRGKGGVSASARGDVLVFFPEGRIPRLKEFGRGSEIYIEGGFAGGGSSYGKTPLFIAKSVHITRSASRFEQRRTGIRLALINAFSPSGDANQKEWGGLALALLLGIRDNLDGELAEKYKSAGCSYILALSGMHLAIVSSVVAFFLRKPLGKRLAAAVGIIFILMYVFIVGVQPSLLRAAIMYVIGSIAIIYALPVNPAMLLGLSFMIQIVACPNSGDTASFILSYLALAGILTIGQWIACLFRGRLPECAAVPLSASLGAFTGTMAASVLFFGSLQPISVLAGLVMAPLTTVFMIGAIACLAIYFLIPAMTAFAGRVMSLLYRLLDIIASVAGHFPGISTSNVIFSVIISIVIPFIIFIVYLYIHKKRIYLERFA